MKELFSYKYDDLFNPTLIALHNLGGSGSIEEIEEQVSRILNLTDEQITEIHRGNTSKFSYRLAWARNYLKRYGVLENSSRGVWALNEQGLKTKKVDKEVVKRKVVSEDKQQRLKEQIKIKDINDELVEDEELQKYSWQELLIEELQAIKPAAFERLCQRLLRELGISKRRSNRTFK